MNETTTEPAGNTYPSNEVTINKVLRQLTYASIEIGKAGNELYRIVGLEQPTNTVYDALPLVNDAIVYLERLLKTE